VEEHPVRLIISDDLERRRLTVFFRLLLVIPHLIWLLLWGIAAFFAAIANWFATLFTGTPPAELHAFLARYVRYVTHVYAYLYLAANPYPSFEGRPGYPVDVTIEQPRRQNRWTVAFRLILALPSFLLAAALVGSTNFGYGQSGSKGGSSFAFSSGGLVRTVAVLAWFAILARGTISRGLRDCSAYGIAYGAQLWAYLFLLTDRYPDSDPLRALPELPARRDPIDVQAGGELRRSRLTVFFRALLALPHLVWLTLWGLIVLLAAIVSWFATLFAGRTPPALHNFIARFVRYQVHVYAFLYLIGNPFPGFTGAPASYPVEASIAAPRTQNRWKVGFRVILAIPALLVGGAYGALLTIAAVLGWFAALVTGRMPRGLRNAGGLAVRYHAQTSAYFLLLTDSYPYSGPFTAPAAEETAAAQLDPFAASG
jgi:hypothetical protein